MLSDAEWAQVAARVMHRTGLAPDGDDLGVRWVAVRHAADHIHIVATLARQDGTRPRIWNDYYRVREACQEAERRFGLRSTAPADRTAARRATRAETEQAARRGWAEPPRVTLRREVCTAAAGAGTEQEFFARLRAAGVLVRERHSTVHPVRSPGTRSGCPATRPRDGGVVWYGGGKLAADLTLPKLRARWAGTAGTGAVHWRNRCSGGSGRAARCGPWSPRRRTTQRTRPGSSPGCARPGCWSGCGSARPIRDRSPAIPSPSPATPGRTEHRCGTGRSAGRRAHPAPAAGPLEPATGRDGGTFRTPRFTAPERDAIYRHAARQAAAAAEHIRRCAHDRSGRRGRCRLGGRRHAARRGAGAAQPAPALCGRLLRPGRPRRLRADPARAATTATSCAAPPG